MVLIACELASKWSGGEKEIGMRSKLSVVSGRKEAGGARSFAAHRIAHLLLSCNTYDNNMSIW